MLPIQARKTLAYPTSKSQRVRLVVVVVVVVAAVVAVVAELVWLVCS
jgi:hypothetical protein